MCARTSNQEVCGKNYLTHDEYLKKREKGKIRNCTIENCQNEWEAHECHNRKSDHYFYCHYHLQVHLGYEKENMLKEIRHSGIVVSDINKSLFFYINILGFRIYNKGTLRKTQAKSLLGLNQCLYYYKLLLGSNLIELYYFKKFNRNNKTVFKRQSLNHIAFTVENIQKCWDKINFYKLKIVSNKILTINHHKLFFARDYDDNLIEFVEPPTLEKK